MRFLNWLAWGLAGLISLGEVARFWGDARFIPMALDELLVAAALIWAGWRGRNQDAQPHLVAWGAFSGLMLVLLVETATHQIHGPAKAAGPLYLAALSVLLITGLGAIHATLRLLRRSRGR